MLAKPQIVPLISIILCCLSTHLKAACDNPVSIKGRILNNAQANGMTLGVMKLKIKGKKKMNCGINGIPQFPAPPNFIHTMVCDDKAGHEEAQSQMSFKSSLVGPPSNIQLCTSDPKGPVSFDFEELSVPFAGTGIFINVSSESEVTIKGYLNCEGGIRMSFKGFLCFKEE